MKKPKRSPGFSLILSLTVMVGIVLLLLTLSAFITIESRAAMTGQLATRARLNGIVAMRLALAHLQQTAGPDRRSTARAEITQPEVVFAYKFRNPMWTGVWRSDLPEQPPAWLVSGRGEGEAGLQSFSLFDAPDYPAGYWAPWQAPPTVAAEDMVELVGTATASPAEGDKPSGLVALPKVALPDDAVNGKFAYWVGDEGVKARINILDRRSKNFGDIDQLAALRSPLTHGLLKGLPKPDEIASLTRLKEAPLLSGFSNLGAGGIPPDVRRSYHDVSMVSAGVLADAFNGGLKRDLSRAFELSDDAFAGTEFGAGRNRTGADAPDGSAGTHTENGYAGRTTAIGADDPMMMPIVSGKTSDGDGAAVAAPIFSRTVGSGQVRGPAWWALRDYHRLYKQLGWSAGSVSGRGTTAPELLARTFWPNTAVARPSGKPEDYGLHDNGIRNQAFSYSDIYDGSLPTTLNPNASDVMGGDKGRLVTRPLHVAATPYIQRVSLAFSFSKSTEDVIVTPPRPYRGPPVIWKKHHIYLNVTPIVVAHNPYNVRMRWQATNPGTGSAEAYPAAVSLAGIDGWRFRMRQGALLHEEPLTKLLKLNGSPADTDDAFRIYLGGDAGSTAITLEPGEMRVFTAPPTIGRLTSITDWTQSTAATNQFSRGTAQEISEMVQRPGGTYDAEINEEEPFVAEVIPGPSLRLRHALDCWPGDKLLLKRDGTGPAGDKLSFFRDSSEHSELVITGIPEIASGRLFDGVEQIPHKYQDEKPTSTGPTLPPTPFTVIDISAKTADSAGAPFPLFTHSNPMAASLRASGAGRAIKGTIIKGVQGTTSSFHLTVRSCSRWEDVMQQPDGLRSFGGYSTSASGAERVILTEIPLLQPTSLAQYAHANFGTRDQQPLLAVGNSFASPLLDAKVALANQDGGRNWTEFDQSYLLNAALWDGFFLSSLAPRMKTEGTPATLPPHPRYRPDGDDDDDDDDDEAEEERRRRGFLPMNATQPLAANETKTLASVIDDFVFKGVPLDNPRFSVDRSGVADDVVRSHLDDYRRSAAVLLNQGAFNVNSTSVDAWATFLGCAKEQAMQGLAGDTPSKTNNARFARTITKQDTPVATGNAEDRTNWHGVANLSDDQIRKLAKAIVAENKARFGVRHRGERELTAGPGPRLFGGQDKSATPYLGLAEFINRFLCADEWANRCGALQAAIFRADADAARLSDRLAAIPGPGIKVNGSSLTDASPDQFPHAKNIEMGPGGERLHTALAATGNLLQSDLLQTLGSALTTRSDTFTIRCFGEAANPTGETGLAWMEVVVQRTPEFIDRTNPAETGSAAPKPLSVGAPTSNDATVSRTLTPLNHTLGRRFKVISMRWLKGDEI